MKRIIAMFLLLCMFCTLAACREKTPSDEQAAPDIPDSGEYAGSEDFDWAAYEGVTVDIMWQDTDDTQRDIMKYVMEDVGELSAGYGFRVNWIGNRGDADYTSLAATGTLADIWFSNVTMEMLQAGIVLDLTPYVTVDDYLYDLYADPDLLYFRDHVWALSTGVDSRYSGVLYYNKDIFTQVGVEELETYTDLVDALRWIHEAGYGGLTFDGGNQSVYTRFLWQDTLTSVDPAACMAVLNGQEDAFENPSVADSFRQILELGEAGWLGSDIAYRSAYEALTQFASGEYAMLYTNSWNSALVMSWVSGAALEEEQGAAVSVTQEEKDDEKDEEEERFKPGNFEIGVALWPSANEQYPTGSYLTGWGSPLSGWSVNADTEYPELAVEIVKVIVNAEAERHLNAGYETNHMQEEIPVPPDSLEAQRFLLLEEVGTMLPNWNQNAADADVVNAFCEALSAAIHAEAGPDPQAILREMQGAWEENTFFDAFDGN